MTNLPSDKGIVDATYHRPLINGKQVTVLKEPGTICSVARNPKEFYRTMYCMRGEMENRIKEQQMCLFADRTSCTSFMANQFRLLLSSFAYVLVDSSTVYCGLSEVVRQRLTVTSRITARHRNAN